MEIGDTVRLKQPFRPQLTSPVEYQFGVVVGITYVEFDAREEPDGVVVHLYAPDTTEFYVDEFGMRAEFQFYLDEIELPP